MSEVIPEQPVSWSEDLSDWAKGEGNGCEPSDASPHVVALDFGMKWNIARHLFHEGLRVTILPGTASPDEVLALEPDGIFLSNGPGGSGTGALRNRDHC